MANCLVPDFPGVNVALEHLTAVDKQLRDKGVSFSEEACHHLRAIADAITDLEASRKAALEELEVETIDTSKLRHQLLCQRDHITSEVSAGVAAAREANSVQLSQLQTEIEATEKDIGLMEKRWKLLEEQNAVLAHDQELLKGRHAEFVTQLNLQLSDRADKQIALTKTLNETQSIKVKITQVDTARNDLGEDMVKERIKFAERKKMLATEITKIMKNINEQKQTNASARRHLDVISAELANKEEQVKEHSEHISKLEKNITRLTTSQRKHNDELKHKSKTSEELSRQKEVHDRELQEMRKKFHQNIQALEEKIPELETEIEKEWKVNGDRLESIAKLSGSFSVQRRREDEALEEHHKLSRQLLKSKQRLEQCIGSIAKYKLEVKEMEEEKKQLQETNIVNAEMFQKNVEDLERQLSKEQMSRAAFEVKRDELCRSLEGLKTQHEHRVVELSSAIALMKTRQNKLQAEEKKLQDHVAMSSLIEDLTNKVARAEEECRLMEIDYQAEIQQLTMEAELMTQAGLDEEEALKAQESVLEETEAQFETDQSRHETLTKRRAELNSRKTKLEVLIQKVKERTAALLGSKEELKQELEALRAKHMQTLANQAARIITVEKTIYADGLMLEQVTMENSRLHLCIEQIKEDILVVKKDEERHAGETAWLRQQVQTLNSSLMEDWVIDKLVTKESTERDEKVLEGMHRFTVAVRAMVQRIGAINARVEEELAALSPPMRNRVSTEAHKKQPTHQTRDQPAER
ncbi:coiled-coil domain-containing protein 175 [Brachyhypopomus gauderio]|uniref:coiled-coil domain-containing protein 175 n=1 Tax=Brachyhypopomus gauderio TaxID=698409 RepID=UPI004042D6D9